MSTEIKEGFYHFFAEVNLNGFQPADLHIELYADAQDKKEAIRQEMLLFNRSVSNPSIVTFVGRVPADIPQEYYTPRILPKNKLVFIPLECNEILWFH